MSPVVRYTLQPSGDGYLLPGWYGAEQRQHCVSGPHKGRKMAAINVALASCSTEHPVFYEDEVDIHLNPKSALTGSYVGSKARCHAGSE
jgi:hypothetical protein